MQPVTPEKLEAFRASVENLCNDAWRADGYTHAKGCKIKLESGPKFARLVKCDWHNDDTVNASGSAHCFVELATGQIFKAAGWKGPEKKNPRGNVHDANPLAGVTQYGVIYLR